VTASEQAQIEAAAPSYLRNIIVIMVEMGLRPYRELTPMRKSQIDLVNGLVHLPDSKTASGIADMPMTARARESFQDQIRESGDSEYLFPTTQEGAAKPHLTTVKKSWALSLERAGIPHFTLYELRHTFATRLSAGGVAVFKRYSQAKLNMMREALDKLDRNANERPRSFRTLLAS